MRRLALLLAGGALWLILAASAAYADGGPHSLTLNSGTGSGGLSGDCAACHRAHTAQAADLLKSAMPGLCLTCHDGTGATTDVADGYQFTPDGVGNPTTEVLGALRGGGFEYTLIDHTNGSRLSYSSRGSIAMTWSGGAWPSSGSVILTWPAIPPVTGTATVSAFAGFAGGTLTVNATDSLAAIQNKVNTLFGTSTTYTGSTAAANLNNPTTNNITVASSATGLTFAPHNEFRLVKIPLPVVAAPGDNTTGTQVTITAGVSVGGDGHVGVLAVADKAPVTSSHEGLGTVWGNGPQGSNTTGATGLALECTSCHNPHGNGQYRILNTLPGEDWTATSVATTLSGAITSSDTTITVASATGFPEALFAIKIEDEQLQVVGGFGTTTWTVSRGFDSTTPASHASGLPVTLLFGAPTNAVEVKDGVALTGHQVRNYTVKPSTNGLTTGVDAGPTNGDYWRYKYDPSGAANFTNFYLRPDEMNTGWNGTSKTNAATNGGVAPVNTSGLMTAWCITCHTRYDGNRLTTGPIVAGKPTAGGAPSLNAQQPMDDIFKFKHGTTSVGCEQCHVSHGTDAVMYAQFSAGYEFPDGTPEDSALLKVDNRGTCQLCHDPTGTVQAGTKVGAIPLLITPGP